MTSTTPVRAHTRRKPEKPAVYIETHAKLRAEVEAMRRVNKLRDEIEYEPGTSALLLIAGRLKVLALKAKEILN